jgi:DNA replication and repair protein RecF
VHLRNVTLRNYRNFGQLKVEPHPVFNLLVGRNAQGKTNFLEALFTLATSKSFRAFRESELLRFTEPFALVGAHIQKATGLVRLEIQWQREGEASVKKRITINECPCNRLIDFMKEVKMVLFTPADLDIIRGGPGLRRRYLDMLLSKLSPTYLFALQRYQKVVEERNNVLRNCRSSSWESMMEVWDDQLVLWGTQLLRNRLSFIDNLESRYARLFRQMGGEGAPALHYVPSIPLASSAEDRIRYAFQSSIKAHSREERERQMTMYGPHRDDLALVLDGRPMRLFGSQGQARCAALSLRLAEAEILGADGDDRGIILLDDCLSEIDAERQRLLLDLLAERGQIFLSCTQAPDRTLLMEGKEFLVEGGGMRERP